MDEEGDKEDGRKKKVEVELRGREGSVKGK